MKNPVVLLTLCLCLSRAHVLTPTRDENAENNIIQEVPVKEENVVTDVQAEHRDAQAEVSAISAPANLSDVQATLREMSLELRRTIQMVDELKRKDEGVKVAFSSSLYSSGSGYVGPYSGNDGQLVLIFRHVFTNIGNAYNPNTGVFTAPIRGVYHFTLYIYSEGHASHPGAAVLVKNGQQMVIAYGKQAGYSVNSSNGISLVLEAGDTVNTRIYPGARIYDNDNKHTTFSGYLLFPM